MYVQSYSLTNTLIKDTLLLVEERQRMGVFNQESENIQYYSVLCVIKQNHLYFIVCLCAGYVAQPHSGLEQFDSRFCLGRIKWPPPCKSMVHPCFSAEAHFYRCTGQTSHSLSFSFTLSLSLSGCLSPSLSLAHSSHSLLGIRPQPQCCDGRWQLAQKGWHVIGKCAAPKMSFLIKRFWSVVNCRMLEKMRDSMWSQIQWHDMKG